MGQAYSVYDQQGNVKTHNMIMWMWVALEDVAVINADPHVQSTSANKHDIIWKGLP